MPNQMIALQARAPQTSGLTGMVQQNAALMNQMTQQAAAQRQAQQAQQAMEIARSGEARAAALHPAALAKAGAEADNAKLALFATAMVNFREDVKNIIPGDLASAEAARAAAVRAVPTLDATLPPAQLLATDATARFRAMASSTEWLNKNVTTPSSSLVYGKDGGTFSATVGGAPGVAGVTPLMVEGAPGAPAPAPAAAPGAIPPPPVLNDAQIARPDRDAAMRMSSDFLTANPIAFNPAEGGASVPPLTEQNAPQIIQAAMQSGMIDETHVQQLRRMLGPQLGPQTDQALATWMKGNNVRIQPAGQPSMQSAEYRQPPVDYMAGGVSDAGQAAPNAMLRQVSNAPGTQFFGKDPMQSPAPGSVLVPNTTIRGQAEAQGMGSGAADVVVKPAVKAGELRVARLDKLRTDIPAAYSQTDTVVADLARRIQAIDEFLRNPHRNRIIGGLEGRIGEGYMDESRADVYALWSAIKNNSILDQLIEDRQKTETGASPMGIISDRDLMIAAAAANRLTRIGSEAGQETEMKRLRKVLYDTLTRAVKGYDLTYGELLPSNAQFRMRRPNVPDRYLSRDPNTGATRARAGSHVRELP